MRGGMLAGAILLGLGLARAAEVAAISPEAPMDGAVTSTERAATPVPPVLAALAADTRAAISEREARAELAPAPEAEALQREIIELKRTAELRRLELLATACRESGREDEALRAEGELARLLAAPRMVDPAPFLSLEEKLELERRNATRQPAATLPVDATGETEGGAR